MHFTITLEHALMFLTCMVNEHVFMNLVSLSKKFQPSLILRFGESMHISGITTTRIKWVNQCTPMCDTKCRTVINHSF